ncbi:hypothetical protein [Corallococcus sp. AB038B]|uniref:hypothetical protein n=1 Tax=Corallococcus sp. AB038B TaxID=2316718 RepID=UPI0011C42D84|nr:hypothetical protein [Corallococcus sp. AB038B]
MQQKNSKPTPSQPDRILKRLLVSSALTGTAVAVSVFALTPSGREFKTKIALLVISMTLAVLGITFALVSEYGKQLRALFGLAAAQENSRLTGSEYRRLRDQLRRQLTIGVHGGLSNQFKRQLTRQRHRNPYKLLLVINEEERELKRQLSIIAKIKEELQNK